jgi:hypothetical protein
MSSQADYKDCTEIPVDYYSMTSSQVVWQRSIRSSPLQDLQQQENLHRDQEASLAQAEQKLLGPDSQKFETVRPDCIDQAGPLTAQRLN